MNATSKLSNIICTALLLVGVFVCVPQNASAQKLIFSARVKDGDFDFAKDSNGRPYSKTGKWDLFNADNTVLESNRMGNTPEVIGGYARFWMSNYNDARQSFKGQYYSATEVNSKRPKLSFGPPKGDAPIVFKARMRFSAFKDALDDGTPLAKEGVDAGFFAWKGPTADVQNEIDFEALRKQIPNKKMWINSWRDGAQFSDPGFNHGDQNLATVEALGTGAWAIYEIRWYEDRVEWWVDGRPLHWANGQPAIAKKDGYPTPSPIPLEVHLNIWGIDGSKISWPQAGSLPIASSASNEQKSFFDVEWVEVYKGVSVKGAGK